MLVPILPSSVEKSVKGGAIVISEEGREKVPAEITYRGTLYKIVLQVVAIDEEGNSVDLSEIEEVQIPDGKFQRTMGGLLKIEDGVLTYGNETMNIVSGYILERRGGRVRGKLEIKSDGETYEIPLRSRTLRGRQVIVGLLHKETEKIIFVFPMG